MTTTERKVVKAGKHQRIRELVLNITKHQRQWLDSNQRPGEGQSTPGSRSLQPGQAMSRLGPSDAAFRDRS